MLEEEAEEKVTRLFDTCPHCSGVLEVKDGDEIDSQYVSVRDGMPREYFASVSWLKECQGCHARFVQDMELRYPDPGEFALKPIAVK